MTKILVLGTGVLAVDPVDTGDSWETPGQVIPKAVAAGAQLVDADLPGDFSPARYMWNGTDVVPMPTAPQEAPPRRITKLAFRNRFTVAEKVAIDLASIDDPSSGAAARQQAAAVRVSLADAAAAAYIDLARDDTRAGVLMLEAAGILGAGRALEILDADIQPHERVQ
ncbi:hypothetical protein [Massilia sp. Root418]|uniref:hypothetical protein n=1 Tax=Massilia sp. Root418 TaxID=1736532 RepID=UPI000B11B314|nr:hypothetical protein [Massilia sp. Root418]